MKKVIAYSVAALVLSMGFTSCKKDSDDDAAGNSFKVRMTDGPGDFLQLNMQVSSVDVYHEGNGWVNLSSQTQSMNVLNLTNGSEMTLSNSTNITAGHYTKLRVTFASQASVMLVGGTSSLNLNWTANTQQVEIVIDENVSTSTGANLLIDFNVAQSITELAGAYSINPVITVIEDESTGAKGQVQGASSVAVEFTNGSSTYSTYVNSQGNFLLRGIQPGTYTASFMASGSIQAHEVNNVVVSQGQITSMGQIQL